MQELNRISTNIENRSISGRKKKIHPHFEKKKSKRELVEEKEVKIS